MNAYILSLTKEANLKDQWDFGFLNDFLTGKVWKPSSWQGFDIKNVSKLPKTDTAIVAIPARHHKGLEAEVNKQLQRIDNVVLFLMGDEEADFDVELIDHKSIHIWVQNPHLGKHDAYNRIGTGYPTHMRKYMHEPLVKDLDVFFSGQVTHDRRLELSDVLEANTSNYDIEINRTKGFTQGYSKQDYYDFMHRTRIAPAPSGAVIPDSFRLFEGLESLAVVVADQKTPSGEIMEYWDWLFGEITPFHKVTNWFDLNNIMPEVLDDWYTYIFKQTTWWISWKRKFAYKVMEQLSV